MDSDTIVTWNFADALLQTTLSPLSTPPTEPCCICQREYGVSSSDDPMEIDSDSDATESSLALWVQLPFFKAPALTEADNDPVQMACRHIFCLYCICRWLASSDTCPMCRGFVDVPYPDDESDTDSVEIDPWYATVFAQTRLIQEYGLENDDINLAQRAASAARPKPRQVLTTPLPEDASFVWSSEHLIADLSRIMALIADRFARQAAGMEQQTSPMFMALPRNPLWYSIREIPRRNGKISIDPDGPSGIMLNETYDGKKLFDVLSHLIEGHGSRFGFQGDRFDVGSIIDSMLLDVQEMMPYADGGVGKARWYAYVRLVLKYLVGWQWHCERVERMRPSDWVEYRRWVDREPPLDDE